MELRHLRYFVAVAEKLHFSRAAEELNISTPTLSHQIQALERMLGAQLLSRKKKSAVALTHTGERFLEEARATLRQAENAELVGKRAARGDIGTVAIGYILSASCMGLLPDLIGNFRKANPGVSLQIVRMETFPQMKALIDGILDVAFIRAPQRYPPELTGFVVDCHPYYVAIPKGHPLARSKQITLAMLAQEPFVAGSLELEVGFWGNLGAIAKPGQSIRIVQRTSDIFSLLTFVVQPAREPPQRQLWRRFERPHALRSRSYRGGAGRVAARPAAVFPLLRDRRPGRSMEHRRHHRIVARITRSRRGRHYLFIGWN